MCILCVIQKWSRRAATMLPWLVIPLIGLWALSQLLPPAFRFEITSPRLACVLVLLITLFWYEILMPQLSAWRMRRNARLRERKRFEAIEMQKLRKTATRRCRNCLNPYKDQNPGGGRFMCSYCGHVSKRPVLDLPVPPGLAMSNSGIIKDFIGNSGKIFNGKVRPENGWICSHDWSENGNWIGGSLAGKSGYWRKNGSSLFGEDQQCFTEKSYSGVVIFVCKLLTSFLSSIWWLWRKIFRINSSQEQCLSDGDNRVILVKRAENGTNAHESRGEKARRKAEEKRQARLERELLEEEERKQREEVARLVEERRKLRDEKMEAEKGSRKSSLPVREKESKKEAEKRRQEKRKEKDKGSSKSNSDAEELERKAGKENELKRDVEKKSEIDRREHHKSGMDNAKNADNVHVTRNSTGNSHSKGNTSSRYFDRVRGTFLSSSKAFGFGRGTNSPTANMMKENRFNTSADHVHNSTHRKEFFPPERVNAKSNVNGDDKNINRTVFAESRPWVAPKKTWQQLFTRSSSIPQTSKANVIGRPNSKFHIDVQSPCIPVQSCSPLTQTFDNPISFGLPSPFNVSTFPSISTTSSLGFSPPVEPIYPHVGQIFHDPAQEDLELFEDPCYVPDPVSLLGPVSESLDNFQLDFGAGCIEDREMERPHALKNISVGYEVNKPSPIESPLSREKHSSSNWFPSAPTPDMNAFALDNSTSNEKGTWQMWNSSPLVQEGLGLVSNAASWLSVHEWNKPKNDDFVHSPSQKTMASLFTNEDQILSGPQSPQSALLGCSQNCGPFSPEHGQWLPNGFFPSVSHSENQVSLKPQDDATRNEMVYGSPTRPSNLPFESCWSKNDSPVLGSGEGVAKGAIGRPLVGSLNPNSDVQSVWKFS